MGVHTAPSVTWVDSSTLTAMVPLGPTPGSTVHVTVVNANGDACTLPGGLDCESSTACWNCIITASSPSSGPVAGGNTVCIQGQGFCTGTQVWLGSGPAVVVSSSSTELCVIAPPALAPGPVDADLVCPNGQVCHLAVCHLAGGYLYQ